MLPRLIEICLVLRKVTPNTSSGPLLLFYTGFTVGEDRPHQTPNIRSTSASLLRKSSPPVFTTDVELLPSAPALHYASGMLGPTPETHQDFPIFTLLCQHLNFWTPSHSVVPATDFLFFPFFCCRGGIPLSGIGKLCPAELQQQSSPLSERRSPVSLTQGDFLLTQTMLVYRASFFTNAPVEL